MESERRVLRHEGEVPVGMEDLGVGSKCHGGDQAVDQAAGGGATLAATAVERCGPVVVGEGDPKQAGACQQSAKREKVLVVPGTSENLHHNDIAGRKVVIEQVRNGLADR